MKKFAVLSSLIVVLSGSFAQAKKPAMPAGLFFKLANIACTKGDLNEELASRILGQVQNKFFIRDASARGSKVVDLGPTILVMDPYSNLCGTEEGTIAILIYQETK